MVHEKKEGLCGIWKVDLKCAGKESELAKLDGNRRAVGMLRIEWWTLCAIKTNACLHRGERERKTSVATAMVELVHIVHALTIHPREIQTMWSHNHDAGSYETLCEVDSSSGDVVIYWTMTGTHVVPDRQQYDEHTHQADMIPGVSISYQTAL